MESLRQHIGTCFHLYWVNSYKNLLKIFLYRYTDDCMSLRCWVVGLNKSVTSDPQAWSCWASTTVIHHRLRLNTVAPMDKTTQIMGLVMYEYNVFWNCSPSYNTLLLRPQYFNEALRLDAWAQLNCSVPIYIDTNPSLALQTTQDNPYFSLNTMWPWTLRYMSMLSTCTALHIATSQRAIVTAIPMQVLPRTIE